MDDTTAALEGKDGVGVYKRHAGVTAMDDTTAALEGHDGVGVCKRGAGTTADRHHHVHVDRRRTQRRTGRNRQRRTEDRCNKRIKALDV